MESQIDIIVLTYNQESTVRATLDSLLAQKCSVKFNIVINDDCSSDNTPNILLEYKQKYKDVIDLQLNKNNLGIPGNYYNAVNRSHSRYLCSCPGDDRWCDDTKIQKQFDYLESHPDCMMVYTDYIEENNGNCKKVDVKALISFGDLLMGNSILASSTFFRRSSFEKYAREVNCYKREWIMEDYPMWLWMSLKGNLGHIRSYSVIYSINDNSITHKPNYIKRKLFQENVNVIRSFFYDIHPTKDANVEQIGLTELRNLSFVYGKYDDFKTYNNQIINKSLVFRVAANNKVFFYLIRLMYNLMR